MGQRGEEHLTQPDASHTLVLLDGLVLELGHAMEVGPHLNFPTLRWMPNLPNTERLVGTCGRM